MSGRPAGLCAVTLAVAALALPLAARAATYVVQGTDDATILVPAGVRVEPYVNSGYRLEVEESTARIRVESSPFGSRQPFRIGRVGPASGGAPAQLARAVAADARTRFEAASRILAWVAANVRYDLDRSAPQDAASVLARRSAYCTGVARLTVALLDALGIPAREVAGYVVDDLPGGGRSGFHRWVELYYDDRGWVFADPLATHHFVPASYLRLASSALESEFPGPALVLARDEALREVDLKSPAPGARVRARPNGGERYAAALRLISDAPGPATLALDGAGGSFRRELIRGEAVVLGIPPSTYELRLWTAGRLAAERTIEIVRPEWRELELAVGAEPARRGGGKR